MHLNEYQMIARKTAIYPEINDNLTYPLLGLCGESGELANKVKKIYRDDFGILTGNMRNDLIEELGDVLWYAANIASELEIDLNSVAKLNLNKLHDRETRGVIQGSGDKR